MTTSSPSLSWLLDRIFALALALALWVPMRLCIAVRDMGVYVIPSLDMRSSSLQRKYEYECFPNHRRKLRTATLKPEDSGLTSPWRKWSLSLWTISIDEAMVTLFVTAIRSILTDLFPVLFCSSSIPVQLSSNVLRILFTVLYSSQCLPHQTNYPVPNDPKTGI